MDRVLRNKFYSKIPNFWDRLYGMEYALFDCLELTSDELDQIKRATTDTYRIYKKISHLIRGASNETLLDLGFPEKALSFLRNVHLPYETVIGRFDFVMLQDGPKIIEFNSDTPTFIRELFEVNGLVCEHFGIQNPNSGEDVVLGKAIRNSVFHCANDLELQRHPYVIFTAHEDDIEDRETMMYLMDLAKIKGAHFIPLQEIQLITEGENKGVYDLEGNKVDIVYRHTYPMEALLEDVSDNHFPIGIEFMKLVEEKKVGMLNPVSAFLMQSKAIMALIWGMYEQRHSFFTQEEQKIIHQYFLPTYLDEDPFVTTGEKYVSKPAFGREGNTVEVKQNGKTLYTEQEKSYDHYVKVFQKYIELPVTTIKTEHGEKEAHLLIGSFIVNEKASAFGFRAGAKITDNLSYFLPCGVRGEAK
ncbi:glutathionylspermidine synthase family protein [Anaerobacillus sp. CMMVII]|uniref:glutathionylspermidine synthase family protein n=1 Tax=Anaerobacillus sp. CMMVII TaxID=2755588 RepID=UPI0021B7974C|nr:glutathionylspermidine synthase family protein [Anaerobacillus sp. CMMVII]MCT8138100.1 glutathionylspermidine synthase family protein [Anaerobacillus sp. CMMVII]